MADLLNQQEYIFGIFKKNCHCLSVVHAFPQTACFYAISGCFALAAAALALALASLKVKFINQKFFINENERLRKGGLMCYGVITLNQMQRPAGSNPNGSVLTEII